MQDHLGSTSGTTDSAGTLTSTISYFSFGAICSSTGSSPTDKKFTGQILDNTGLYYYNARYYDPQIGRFISADTIVPDPADPQSLNRYSYCLNNPLKYIDPSGHDPVDSLGGIGYYYSLCEQNGVDPDSGVVFVLNEDGDVEVAVLRNEVICWTGQYSYIRDPLISVWTYLTNPDLFYAVENLNRDPNSRFCNLELFQLLTGLCGPIGPVGGIGKANALKYPEYVNLSKPSTLVSYAQRLEASKTMLTAKQADQLVIDCQKAGVDFRFDTGVNHRAPWTDVPHLNIGNEGQAHVLVPPGWTPPTP